MKNDKKTESSKAETWLEGDGPKYEVLKNILKNRIRKGLYGLGDKLPSENELVVEFGISRHTVLKGLAGLSAEGWVERQQGKGTFVSQRYKDKLISSNVVALVAGDLEDGVMSQIIRGLSISLSHNRKELLILNSNHDIEHEGELFEELEDRGVGGAVIWTLGIEQNAEKLTILAERGFPVVLIDRKVAGVKLPFVATNHEGGAYQATKYLIDLGHRKIAHITFAEEFRPSAMVVELRLKGYLRAMQEAGLDVSGKYIRRVSAGKARMAHQPGMRSLLAYEETHSLMVEGDRPTAIFMLNDQFAPSIYAAVQNQGLRVPENISLVGFDNDPSAWERAIPLTTYSQPVYEIGRKAGELVLNMINGELAECKDHYLDGKLIVRQSTARQSEFF